jgi:hypothetical protein
MTKESGFIRICESEWHKPVELHKFEKCPKCDSTAYHLSTVKGRLK